MKCCLILQRTFAIIGNAIAAELKNRGVDEFCVFTDLRRSEEYLKKQKEVKYTSLLVEEDIHKKMKNEKLDLRYLKYLEEKYGIPTLWEYITPDRTFMMGIPPHQYRINPNPMYGHEELLKCLQIRFRTIIDWLEKEKPDILLCAPVGAMSTLILYHVAKKMGIKVINIDFGRIKNRITLSEDYTTLTYAEELFKKIQGKECEPKYRKEAAALLKEIRNQKASYQPQLGRYNSLKEIKFLKPKNFLKSATFFAKSIIGYLKRPYKDDYLTEIPWIVIKDKLIRVLRNIRGFSDLYGKPDWNENFCYYQLHLEPEIAISVLAPFYPDQIHLIKQIARSLPVGFKLYVREHRDMANYRPRAFYKELNKIPNVKLIDPSVDLFELLEKAKLVFTITSTAGWEAALLGKQVITFGHVFYNALSSVIHCEKIEKLPYLIKERLDLAADDEELLNYLSALLEESVPSNLFQIWFIESIDLQKIKDNQGLKDLAGFIVRKINFKPLH
jgi:hypothetical protein